MKDLARILGVVELLAPDAQDPTGGYLESGLCPRCGVNEVRKDMMECQACFFGVGPLDEAYIQDFDLEGPRWHVIFSACDMWGEEDEREFNDLKAAHAFITSIVGDGGWAELYDNADPSGEPQHFG